jgi:hypothetical protein
MVFRPASLVGPMIQLLSHPLPASVVRKLYLFLSLPAFCQSSLLHGGPGVGEEPIRTTARKLGPLSGEKPAIITAGHWNWGALWRY